MLYFNPISLEKSYYREGLIESEKGVIRKMEGEKRGTKISEDIYKKFESQKSLMINRLEKIERSRINELERDTKYKNKGAELE